MNTIQFVRTHRTLFLWGYGGTCFAVIFLAGFGLVAQYWGLIPIALALILLLFCRIFLLLWVTRYRVDNEFTSISYFLRQHQLPNPDKHVAYLDLGYRYEVNELATLMVRGRFHLIDLYASYLTPANHLLLARQELRALPNNLPSFDYAVGKVDLLPLANDSVHLVIVPYIWSEILQEGDRNRLLSEIVRILEPNGRLLLLEQTRSYLNWICVGLPALSMVSKWALKDSFVNTSLRVVNEWSPLNALTAVIAQKPGVQQAQQLPLSLYD